MSESIQDVRTTAAQLLEDIIESRGYVLTDTDAARQQADIAKRWIQSHALGAHNEMLRQYLPGLVTTVIYAPFASELYAYAWQELRDELESLEAQVRKAAQ